MVFFVGGLNVVFFFCQVAEFASGITVLFPCQKSTLQGLISSLHIVNTDFLTVRNKGQTLLVDL